ncbi:MAG: hypothetical protein KC419_17135 [Anaerolineales bacterium]|nr:hypothetical protein [Anaerolineales bacterium]
MKRVFRFYRRNRDAVYQWIIYLLVRVIALQAGLPLIAWYWMISDGFFLASGIGSIYELFLHLRLSQRTPTSRLLDVETFAGAKQKLLDDGVDRNGR